MGVIDENLIKKILKREHIHVNYVFCATCGRTAQIEMQNYNVGDFDIRLCKKCALQLARKLLEDICDLEGDRHG